MLAATEGEKGEAEEAATVVTRVEQQDRVAMEVATDAKRSMWEVAAGRRGWGQRGNNDNRRLRGCKRQRQQPTTTTIDWQRKKRAAKSKGSSDGGDQM
ncbi:hypothetical protein BHM03_00045816 [Ensete ventricosum]|nr:hypothetical protein BHM03_00045816 [Ensete ventricosum]